MSSTVSIHALPLSRSPAAKAVGHGAVTPLAGGSAFAGMSAVIELTDADRIVKRGKAFAFVALGAEGREKAGGSRSAAIWRLQFALDAAAQLEAGKQDAIRSSPDSMPAPCAPP